MMIQMADYDSGRHTSTHVGLIRWLYLKYLMKRCRTKADQEKIKRIVHGGMTTCTMAIETKVRGKNLEIFIIDDATEYLNQ